MTVSREAARTLVVVAKAPRLGHVKTRLGGALAPEAIVALYRCLIEDTLDLAGSLPGTHVAVVCPPADVGELRAWLGPVTEIVAQEGHGLAAALDSTFRIFLGDGVDRVVIFNGDSPHLPSAELERAFALLARAGTLGLAVGMTAPWYDVDELHDLARLARDLRSAPASAPRTAALLAQWRLA